MVRCNLCGSTGTNVSNCPLNLQAKYPNFSNHYLVTQDGGGLKDLFRKLKPSGKKTQKTIAQVQISPKIIEPVKKPIITMPHIKTNEEKALAYFGTKYDDLWQSDRAFVNSYTAPKNIYDALNTIIKNSLSKDSSEQNKQLVLGLLNRIGSLNQDHQDILLAKTAFETFGVQAGLASRGDFTHRGISNIVDLVINSNAAVEFRNNLVKLLGI